MVLYLCNTGYEILGSSNRMCTVDGIWSGIAPSCEGILLYLDVYLWHSKMLLCFSSVVALDCGIPLQIANGRVEYAGTSYRAIAEYICDEGYSLERPFVSTCSESGIWSPAPICRSTCGELSFMK